MTQSSRVAVGPSYYVRAGETWETRPMTAAALPHGTKHRFVVVSENDIYDLAKANGRFSHILLTIDGAVGDTTDVRVGRRTVFARRYTRHTETQNGIRPGFSGGGGSRIGWFVRSDSTWTFGKWTGWIGS